MALDKLEVEIKTNIDKNQIINWIFRNTVGNIYFNPDDWTEHDLDILDKATILIKRKKRAKKSK